MIELSDSEYNAYSGTDSIEITVTACDITKDCLLSAFGGAIKGGRTVVRYTNNKGGQYSISNGYDEAVLETRYPNVA